MTCSLAVSKLVRDPFPVLLKAAGWGWHSLAVLLCFAAFNLVFCILPTVYYYYPVSAAQAAELLGEQGRARRWANNRGKATSRGWYWTPGGTGLWWPFD
jgi:hypothetical protein